MISRVQLKLLSVSSEIGSIPSHAQGLPRTCQWTSWIMLIRSHEGGHHHSVARDSLVLGTRRGDFSRPPTWQMKNLGLRAHALERTRSTA